MKIITYVIGFGDRYCSNNVEYELYENREIFAFLKKGTNIAHNEYGPALERKDCSYQYLINDKLHRLSGCAYYDAYFNYQYYLIFNKLIGYTKEDFIKNLANTLIPKTKKYL